MVNRLRDESGKGRLGCLVWMLISAAVIYYGQGFGLHYIQFYRMQQEMESQAVLAPALDDASIRRRLIAKAEELDLPEEARRFIIRRLETPREIIISTSWQIFIEVPFHTYPVTFHPTVDAPL